MIGNYGCIIATLGILASPAGAAATPQLPGSVDLTALMAHVESRHAPTEPGRLSPVVEFPRWRASSYPSVLDPMLGPAVDISPLDARLPKVIFGGTNFLVAWASPSAIFCARIAPEGTLLDPDGILVASVEVQPWNLTVDAAFNGSQYLISWLEPRLNEYFADEPPVILGTAPRNHVVAARLTRDGKPLDPAGILVADNDNCMPFPLPCEWPHPSIAVGTDGANFLVAWSQQSKLFALRVAPSGALLDAEPIRIGAPPFLENDYPSIAFDGANYLVVWGTDCQIAGARIGTDGTLLDPGGFLVSEAGPSSAYHFDEFKHPSVVHDGTSFLVAWLDSRFVDYRGPRRDVYIARVSSEGTVLDPGGVFLSGGAGALSSLRTSFDGRYSLITWTACLDSPDGASCTYATDTYGQRVGGDGQSVDDSPWAIQGMVASAVASDGRGLSLLVDKQHGRFITTWSADTEAPVVSVPSGVCQAASAVGGAVVEFTATAVDAVYGVVPTTCSPVSGSLFPPGETQVTCTATDPEGNVGTASFKVAVTFDWGGVLSPLAADGSATFKVGSTIPVKFRLTGASAGITTLLATASLVPVGGMNATSARIDSSAFRYAPEGGQYILNLGTRGLAAGSWQLRIEMGDGVERAVRFWLR